MTRFIVLLMWGILVQTLRAEDWPQYRGPRRDDVSRETGLLPTWPQNGPPLTWSFKQLGIGYSSVAVMGERLYSIGARGETEFVIALNLKSVQDGVPQEAWAASVGPLFDFKGNNWSAGPSSTPTVDGELLYALGGKGDLVCMQTNNGQERWRKHLPTELDAQVNPIGGGPKGLGWGFTWSPLVDGEQLVCVPGGPKGTVAALHKSTGEVLWRSTEVTDQAAYTSPMLAEFGGVRQYVVLTNQGVFGVAAQDGRLLWNYRRKPAFGTEVVNSPIIHNDLVFVTVGAGQGCELLKVTHNDGVFAVESVFANKNMANHHGNVARVGEHIFGFSEGRGFVCQSLATGEIVWMERSKIRPCSLTVADGRIYAFSEDNGTAVLLETSTTGWVQVGSFRLPQLATSRKPSGRLWTPPVVSNGRLYLRDQEFLFCFDVTAR